MHLCLFALIFAIRVRVVSLLRDIIIVIRIKYERWA